MNFNPNGILIQEISKPTRFFNNIDYYGVNAYYQYPLLGINNPKCQELSNEISFLTHEDGSYTPLEFVSNMHLAHKYISLCREMGIGVRALFVESEFAGEIWRDSFPELRFLGYEYSPIPFDSQVITDFSWYKPLHKFISQINRYGLFDTYDDVCNFKKTYDLGVENNEIGDDMEIYICRVSEVKLEFAFSN